MYWPFVPLVVLRFLTEIAKAYPLQEVILPVELMTIEVGDPMIWVQDLAVACSSLTKLTSNLPLI